MEQQPELVCFYILVCTKVLMQYINQDMNTREFSELERLVLTTNLSTDSLNQCISCLSTGSYVSRLIRKVCANAVAVKIRLGLGGDSKLIETLNAPMHHMNTKLLRQVVNELTVLRNYLLKVRAESKKELQPLNPFLDTSGHLGSDLIRMLQSCLVSTWTLCPSDDRQYYYLDVTGVASVDEFEKRKSDWIAEIEQTHGIPAVPRITYRQTQPMK